VSPFPLLSPGMVSDQQDLANVMPHREWIVKARCSDVNARRSRALFP
jgi:hypothetical protein